MLNELEEFNAYTTPFKYEVSRKGDTTFLGRFTFESLLNFEGLGRIFTILARGHHPGRIKAEDRKNGR